jgi:signal transduction histidine kinase
MSLTSRLVWARKAFRLAKNSDSALHPATNSRSLRQRLLISLTVFSALLLVLLGYSAYRIALEETQEILDKQMKQMAYFLAETPIEQLNSSFRPTHRYDETDVFIDIWPYPATAIRPVQSLSNTPASNTPAARVVDADPDHIRLPRQSVAHFRQMHSSRGELKVFVLPLSNRQIQISQQLKVRRHLAQELALSMLIPYVALVPFLVLGLGWLIRRLFKPVDQLQTSIAARNHGDLNRIDTQYLPLEIKPAIDELNQLFERIAQAQTQQQQFIADAAHELRSPITALNLQLKVLQKTLPEGVTQERHFTNLQQGLQRMQHLVLQMMTLAHQDAQLATDDLLDDRLNDLVAQVNFVLEQLQPSAHKKQLEIIVAVPPSPILLKASTVQLHSIIFNILDNAIKYTPAGGHINISIEMSQDTQDALVYLSVADSGAGVAVQDYAKLTERFVRLPQATPNSVGSGLGLAIVQSAVQQLGGSLHFGQSATLQGLAVQVILPLAESNV